MHFFGKIIKHILRSLFTIIIFLLFIGSAKMDRNIRAYVSFLNNHDRSKFHRSQPAGWTEIFWSNIPFTGSISDILSGDIIDITSPMETSGFDVYDPATEQDFNTIVDSSLSGTNEEGFGFTADSQTTNPVTSSSGTVSSGTTSRTELLNAIKQSPNVQK